ncbi:MAG: formate dehydrogenase accessory protein FdhE [Thermodesulfobacteriota bacterium]
MEKLEERIEQVLKNRSHYQEIITFYLRIKEEQEKVKSFLKLRPVSLRKEWKDLLKREGFSLIEKRDFPLDIEASIKLFHSLCEIGKEANPYLTHQVRKIKEAIDQKRLNLEKVFERKVKEEKVTEEIGVDQKVFSFFLHQSIKPSLEEGVKELRKEIENMEWLKGYCPLCGSLPSLALLKGEGGKRFLLCSYCGFEWRVDRLFCPFCGNKDRELLQYFFAEGEEAYRIDTCDQCHHYIKTIDERSMEVIDPEFEDLSTLHLDLLASKKGYKRPVPHPWAP